MCVCVYVIGSPSKIVYKTRQSPIAIYTATRVYKCVCVNIIMFNRFDQTIYCLKPQIIVICKSRIKNKNTYKYKILLHTFCVILIVNYFFYLIFLKCYDFGQLLVGILILVAIL